MKVQIILPERSDDEISEGLRDLTELITAQAFNGERQAGGGLGGEWGYGIDYENDVFMMHPFCWCDSDDCQWCAGCTCPEGPYDYAIGDRPVEEDEYEAYWASYRAVAPKDRQPPAPWNVWPRDVHARLKPEVKRCRYCRGEFGDAPNFLHKPSGFAVHWYKWIGRGMEFNREISTSEWDHLLSECQGSLLKGVTA